MQPKVHYPAKRRWWRRQLCICGLVLSTCPDYLDAHAAAAARIRAAAERTRPVRECDR